MKEIKIITFILLCLLSYLNSFGQSVSGNIKDEKGEPLIGVTILVEETKQGVISDSYGNYSISVPNLNATLEFSYIGMESQRISLDGRTRIDVIMKESSKELEDVIVVAYGTQKRLNVTGSLSHVDSRELKTAPASNLSSMLQGRMTGLISKQPSGQPGNDGAALYIRGVGAGDGNPLVVVDGVVRPFPQLSPDEIESITILKDATSAAAYGVRASAGVMLITTKKGSLQKPTITLNSSLSLSTNTNFPKFLNGPDYAYWYNKAQELDGVAPENRRFTLAEIERIKNGDPEGTYANTDWFNLLFKKTAPTYTNQISLNGGNESFKYFVSIGSYNQKGIIDRTKYDRYNFRVNLDAQATKNFNIKIGISGRQSITSQPGLSAGIGNSYASIISQALMSYPYLPTITSSGMPIASANGAGNGNQNPLAARDLSGEQSAKINRLESNIAFDYSVPFIKGLNLRLNTAYDTDYSMTKVVSLPYKLAVWNQTTRTWREEYAKHSLTGEARVVQWFGELGEYTLQPSVFYSNKFDRHSFSALLLYEYNQRSINSMTAGRKDFPILDIMDLNFGEKVIDDMVKGGHTINRRAGYVGRLNYAFADKYLFEFTTRLDGTPYLPSRNRWGLFPGVSVGWRMSEENFIKEKINWIDNLKLRASLGTLGSDAALDYSYSYISLVSLTSDPVVMFGNNLRRALLWTSPPNLDLKWQQTDTYNLGIEGSLWRKLLGFEIDVYYMKTYNTLQGQSGNYPPSMGYYYPAYINYGMHENKGLELMLTHENRIVDFEYTVRGTLTYSKNKILRTTEDPNLPQYMRITGKSMGQYFGFEVLGLFQTQEEIDNSPLYGRTFPGDIKLKDINGDGRITFDQDLVPIGRSNIPELIYSINLGANYKNFDLSLFFQGASLFDVQLAGIYHDKDGIRDNTFYTQPFYVDGNTPYYLVENAWRPEKTDAKYPRLGIEQRDNGGKFSSWWVVDGTYIRLKTTQLGYTLPSKLVKKAGFQSLRTYIAGSNLFTLSKLPELDPEMPNVNQGYYPQQRLYEFGISLTF